eukprot:5708-Chlamydomonas_euryale.AAC.3
MSNGLNATLRFGEGKGGGESASTTKGGNKKGFTGTGHDAAACYEEQRARGRGRGAEGEGQRARGRGRDRLAEGEGQRARQ